MTPKEYKQMMDYLTRSGIKDKVKFASDIARPDPKPIVKEIELFNAFNRRNPQADGGRIGFADGTTSKTQTKIFKYPKKYYNSRTKKVETVYSKNPPPSNVGVVSDFSRAKSEASFKAFEDKFGKKLLNKMAQSQYNKNFRELDKNNELKFFKNQVNKYEDFIKENKRYPNKSEAYSIGLKQSGKRASPFTDEIKNKIKNIYTSGKGGSTYISKKLAEEGTNIDDSTIRRFLTAEEQAGRLKRPKKFQTQAADPTLPTDRYNVVREVTDRDLRGFTVGRSGVEVLAPKGSKYKVTFKAAKTPETSRVPLEYQGTQYYKTKTQADNALKGYQKFSKDLKKAGEAGRSIREIILRQISDPNIEAAIGRMKEGEDLATAHRLSYKQVGKLGQLYNIANLGVEDPAINSGAIRRFENKLDRLYEEQRNLIKSAKRSTNKGLPVPKTLQEKIDFNNRKISTVVDLTDKRVQGILIDPKNLKPTTYGIDYMKTYGMGLLKNKNVKDITDSDLATIQLNIENQIKRENKLGKKTESFLRDRQKFIKNIDELAGPRGAEVAEKIGLRPKNIGGGITLGANPFFSPGVLREAFKSIPTPLGAVGLTAGFGVDPTSAIDRAGIAAEAAFAPSLVKQSAKMGAAQRLFNLGFNPRMAMRIARIASPLGIASLGAEGLYQAGKFTKKRIGELKAMTPEQRQELRSEGARQAFDPFMAAGGGIAKLAGVDSGPPPESGPMSQGLQGLMKRVRNR